MRKSLLAAVLAGSTYAAAQPGMPVEEQAPPPPDPIPVAPEPAPPPVSVSGPPGALPPITININNTNNNTGNNSNTNTQTNNQQNPQTNNQTNDQTATQTNSVPVTVTTTVAPPSSVPPVVMPGNAVGRYELFRPRVKPARWIALGVTTDHGMRASIDLIGRGPFSLGIAASASGGDGHHGGGDGDRSAGVVAYVAYTKKLGRLEMRAQLGVGVGGSGDGHDGIDGRRDADVLARSTTGTDPAGGDGDHEHRLAPRAEAALLIGIPLTKHLGVFAGPVLTATKNNEDRERDRALAGDGGHDGHHGGGSVDKAMTAGLRWSF